MEPVFFMDDAVLICKTNPAKLKPGDIITFTAYEANAINTHRISRMELTANGYEFRTMGDNNFDGDGNNLEDDYVTPESRIIGKYILRIPKLATFLDTTKQKPYIILAIVAAILLLQFLCGVGERKLKPAKEEPAAAASTAANVEDPQLAAQQQPMEHQQPAEQQQQPAEQQQQSAEQQQQVQQLESVLVESWNNEKGSASDDTNEG
jgi:signal peptidase I